MMHSIPVAQIENALLLAAEERDRARKDADAARVEAAAERRQKERQTGIVQELKEQMKEVWSQHFTPCSCFWHVAVKQYRQATGQRKGGKRVPHA